MSQATNDPCLRAGRGPFSQRKVGLVEDFRDQRFRHVKAHASVNDVKEGKSSNFDQEGIEQADEQAKEGARLISLSGAPVGECGNSAPGCASCCWSTLPTSRRGSTGRKM
eukprot:7665308-Pyramimonas_sp.AAC.1